MEILFLWVGLLFAWIGILIARAARADFAGARSVEGEVIGYIPSIDEDGDRIFAPVIRYAHPVAGRRILQSSFQAGHFLYPVGQRVRVMVDPRDPARARIGSKAFFYFGITFLVIGAGCSALFFTIFDWGPVSLALAAIVTVALGLEALRKRRSVPKLAEMGRFVRQALASEAVEETSFDRTTMLAASEVAAGTRRQARTSVIAGVVLLLMAGGGFFWSHRWTERRLSFIHRAVPGLGHVVELRESSSSDSTTWAPVVEFRPGSSDSRVRFQHPVASSHPQWKTGEKVRVLYDPVDSSKAMIDQGWWNLALPLMPATVGALTAILGLSVLRTGLRRG